MSGLPIDFRRLHRELDSNFVRVHATYEDFFGEPPDQARIAAEVAGVGLETALGFIGRLSCHVDNIHGAVEGEADRRLLRQLGVDPEVFVQQLRPVGGNPHRTSLAPQHIALALQRALVTCRDVEPSAEDAQTGLRLLRFVVASGEQADPDVAAMNADRFVSYCLRQYGLNSRRVLLYAVTGQTELLTSAWTARFGADADREIDDRLRRAGHIPAAEHLRACFMLYAHFRVFADSDEERAVAIEPIDYLERSGVSSAGAARFVEQYSATASGLRELHAAEVELYRAATWRSTTFDRKPLLRLSSGAVLPTTFQALERLAYEGTYWALRSNPNDDNEFTSRYGMVVEQFVKDAISRVAALDDRQPVVTGDFFYGPRKRPVRSSDVNLRYGADWLPSRS